MGERGHQGIHLTRHISGNQSLATVGSKIPSSVGMTTLQHCLEQLTRLTSSSPTLWYTWHARLARLANSSKAVEFTLLAEPLCLRLAASVLALSRRKHVLHVTSQNRTPLIYETRTPRVETPIFHVEEFALGMHGSEHVLSIRYLSAVGSQ